jgi:L-aspartate oxidase
MMSATSLSVSAVPYADALTRLRTAAAQVPPAEALSREELLAAYHPDHNEDARVVLRVGSNRGMPCHPALACLLEGNALVGDVDLVALDPVVTDVLVIGGGGAGTAATLAARSVGADVVLAAKLRVGDSNTVMAEGGIQAAIGEEDSLQRHFDDTLKGGHRAGEPELIAMLVREAPEVIRWLIGLGVSFDLAQGPLPGGRLLRKRAGGTTAARILSHRDFTGLEMMRVLRETVELDRGVTVLNRAPAIELLSDERGRCVGAVLYDLEHRRFRLVCAGAVVLATGGAGRLHLSGFATSNHYGATADGLALAYRMGAQLRDVDSFQYHPTGLAWPGHLAGGLISEAVRSFGATLVNGQGARFIDELSPRDVVTSAILRECAEGRGVVRDGLIGVFLDTPTLLANRPALLREQLVSLGHLAHRTGIDPTREPMLIYPTLHYQNGGVVIDTDGASTVSGLYCAGEVTGGIHGRNRLMGNALLDIIVFGRRAGAAAARHAAASEPGRFGLGHVQCWQRELTRAGLIDGPRSPILYPAYGHFDLRRHMAASQN